MVYFTSFARDGTPTASGEPPWRPYGTSREFLDIRDTSHASRGLMPGVFDLHEEVAVRRGAAGTQSRYVNIGLA